MIQGFGEEEIEELSAFSLYIGVDFVKIGASVIIMSTIGAITDAAIAISSPMREIFHHQSIHQQERFIHIWIRDWKGYLGNQYEYIILCLLWRLYGLAYMV